MASDPAVKDIHIGAEVAIEKGHQRMENLQKAVYQRNKTYSS